MQNNINNLSPNFNGMIYAKAGHHTAKGMLFCKFGDQEFIKEINKIFNKSADRIDIKFDDKKLLITFNNIKKEDIPEISWWKYLCYQIMPKQNKLLKKLKSGTFDAFTYRLSEKEYHNIVKDPIIISKKQLKTFESNIKTYQPLEEAENSRKFFYY